MDKELTAKERDFIEKHERTHEAIMEEWERNRFNVETDLRINAELEQEAKAKAHASGDLAELLNDELNQKENDDER